MARHSEMTKIDYQTLYEDMNEEINKFGDVERLKIVQASDIKLGGKSIDSHLM